MTLQSILCISYIVPANVLIGHSLAICFKFLTSAPQSLLELNPSFNLESFKFACDYIEFYSISSKKFVILESQPLGSTTKFSLTRLNKEFHKCFLFSAIEKMRKIFIYLSFDFISIAYL